MDCVEVSYSGHALRRMFERSLGKDAIMDTIRYGEVVADYPDDQPHPSQLLLGFAADEPIHVVVARDAQNQHCFVVTAYRPSVRRPVGRRFQDQETIVTCVICKTGQLEDGRTSITLQRGETTIVIKDVPAQICDNCGEYYLSEEMTERVLALAESAVRKGAEVEILRWAA